MGLVSVLTPALTRAGAWFEFAPLSVVEVRAGVEPAAYFGTAHAVLSFDHARAPFDRKSRNARRDTDAALGIRAYVTPALQAARGPLVARVSADIERWASTVRGPYFYEPTRDTLLAVSGNTLVSTRVLALYRRPLTDGTWAAGLQHDSTSVPHARENRIQRLGAVAVREFSQRRFGVPHLRLTAMVWRYLDDPSKHGQWAAAAALAYRTGR